MDREKRKGEKAIPDKLEDVLNDDQLMTLRQIERFGWRLAFVRRPVFQKPIPVVLTADDQKIGVLEEDGRLNMNPDVKLRK
ncbi:MAG TPA: hypothetical protein VGL10_06310 [Gammaproteobacteria bacterium]